MGGEREWEHVMRQAQDDLEELDRKRRGRVMENGKPKRKRVSAARNMEILEAVFLLGVGIGKTEQATLQELSAKVSASSLAAFRAGYAKIMADVGEVAEKKPRKLRAAAHAAASPTES